MLKWKIILLPNSKCRLCGDRNERINHIISKGRKLAQTKYKTWYNWWERRSSWNWVRNWNITIQPNGMCTNQDPSRRMRHKILWDFEIQTNPLFPDWWPEQVRVIIKKRTCRIVYVAVKAACCETLRKRQGRSKNVIEPESDGDTSHRLCAQICSGSKII